LFPRFPRPRAPLSFPTRRSSDLSALARAGLQHPQLALLDGEFNVLHIAVMRLELLVDVDELLVDVGEHLLHRGSLGAGLNAGLLDRKSTRLNSSHVKISYAVFCL